MRLEISDVALNDLADIYRYGVKIYGLTHADAYMAGLKELLALLTTTPMLGRERDEVRPPIRLVPYEAHHVFYDIIGDSVVVQRLLHRSVDWTSGL
jgi:toxin ParE1/3/4